MNPNENNQDGAAAENSGGEGTNMTPEVSLADVQAQLAKSNETIGSLKRELKELRKAQEKSPETPQKTDQSDEFGLLQKSYLRAAQITDEDEIELARVTAKKWGIEVDKLVDDEDFKVKLEKLRTKKANELATSNVRGSGSPSQAKNTPEYWIAKGVPPTREEVPDRKTRAAIARAFMNSAKNTKKFYND